MTVLRQRATEATAVRRRVDKMVKPSVELAPPTNANARGTPSAVAVRPFEPGVAERWDRFVLAQSRGTFFHLLGWKRVIEKTFGFAPRYFYTEHNGKITGVAPFFSVDNWIVGRCLLSVPLAVYGGVCAEDAESEQALVEHVKRLAVSEQVDFLETRNRKGGLLPGFHPNSRYTTFTTCLPAKPEEALKRLPKDTRYMIRKAEKAGLLWRAGMDQLDQFYRLFALSMRRLGTPVFPRALFENLAQEFPKQTDLLLIYAGAQPVAGVFSFFFRDTILPYYAGATPEATVLAANNFMYWQLMKRAIESGLSVFDFGRSKKGTGAFAFKSQWNMNAEPLDYQVFLVRRKTTPNFSPVNPKFELATRLWKRMPFWLTLRVGPHVVRWFP